MGVWAGLGRHSQPQTGPHAASWTSGPDVACSFLRYNFRLLQVTTCTASQALSPPDFELFIL